MSSDNFDKVPPHSEHDERALIGSILMDSARLDDVPQVTPSAFYHLANATIYRAIIDMRNAGVGIDVVTVGAWLAKRGELTVIGGVEYLRCVVNSVAVSLHAKYYADTICRLAKVRSVIRAAGEMLSKAWEPKADPVALVDSCEATLRDIETGDYKGDPRSLDDAILDALADVDAIAQRTKQAGMMTGIPEIDRSIGGLFPGELTVLAARPSVGKTAMAIQIAEHNAKRRGLVYFASLEMKDRQLALRMLCGNGGVSLNKIRAGDINDDDIRSLQRAASRISGTPVLMHDRPGVSTADIRRAVRRLKRDGLTMAVVDYIGRVTPADRSVPRHLQVGQITWDLKAIASEFEIPVLALCQLNRAADDVAEPRLSQLKESGDIEQDADMVWLLHRQRLDSPEATWICAKNRQGATGKETLHFDLKATRFQIPGVECLSKFDGSNGKDF